MNLKLLFILLVTCPFLSVMSQNGLDKKSFYKAMAENKTELLDDQLKRIKKSEGLTAFEGALLMKKSGLITNPTEKMKLFESGRKKLETEIKTDTTQVEYRFLRIMIQENAPKIVHYDQEMKRDALYLRNHYNKLESPVQEALYQFSQKSKVLDPADFKSILHD